MGQLNLRVLIQVVDRATGPVRRVADSLRNRLSPGLNVANRLMGRFGRVSGVVAVVMLSRMLPAIGFVSRGLGRMIGIGARAIGILTGLGIAAGGAFTQGVVRVGIQYETLLRQLSQTEGSVAGAETALERLERFAVDNGIAVDLVTAAYVELRRVGIEPTEAKLASLANAAAGANKAIEQSTTALTSAQAGQFADLEAFGIKAEEVGNRIAFTYEKAGQTIRVEARNNAEAIETALLGIFDTKFAGALEQQKGEMAGLWAQIMGQLRSFKKSVAGAGVFDFIKGELATLLARIKVLSANGQLTTWATEISGGLIELLKSLKSLVTDVDWVGVVKGIVQMANGFADFMKMIGGFRGLITIGVGGAIGWLTTALMGIGVAIAGILGVAAAPIAAVIAAIGLIALAGWFVYRNWTEIVGGLAKMWLGLVGRLVQAWNGIRDVFKAGVEMVWNILPPWFRAVLRGGVFAVRMITNAVQGRSPGNDRPGGAGPGPRPRPAVAGQAANGQVGVDVRVHSDGRPPTVQARSNSRQVTTSTAVYRGTSNR